MKTNPGDRYSRLLVIERTSDYVTPAGKSHAKYKCRCDCGNTVVTLVAPCGVAEAADVSEFPGSEIIARKSRKFDSSDGVFTGIGDVTGAVKQRFKSAMTSVID